MLIISNFKRNDKNTKQAIKKKRLSYILICCINVHNFWAPVCDFISFTKLTQLHAQGLFASDACIHILHCSSNVEVTSVTYINGLLYIHIHLFGFDSIISQRDVKKAKEGMNSACT